MSAVITDAVKAINKKLDGSGFDGSIKIVVEGEGSLLIDENGASKSEAESESDCTITADAETLTGLMTGDVNPAAAFMTGKLSVSGDMSLPMKLAMKLGGSILG